jgi:hypothetical protein
MPENFRGRFLSFLESTGLQGWAARHWVNKVFTLGDK